MLPTSTTAAAVPAAGPFAPLREQSLLRQINQATSAAVLLNQGRRLHGDQLTNDLRLRVLEGEEIDAEEMLLIVTDIRGDRRSAARATPASGSSRTRAKPESRPITTADLKAILDQDDL